MDKNLLLNQKRKKHHKPGKYTEQYSKKKTENNISILHACKILKGFYIKEGITALVLDAEKMNTTKILLKLDQRIKKIIIVENNPETYNKMLEEIATNKLNDKVELHKGIMDKYLEKELDPKINVVYFDLNESFFTSELSYGSDYAINLFLKRSEENEIVFAATFCLRSLHVGKDESEKVKTLLFLKKIFMGNGFNYKQLIPDEKMIYRGNKGNNKALMFVLFHLTKIEDE